MQSQGNFPWYFPAGRLWNNIPLLISTMYYAVLISRWDLSLHIWTWQRSALNSLYMSLYAPDKLASFLSFFPSPSHHTLPLSLARSLAHWLKLIMSHIYCPQTIEDMGTGTFLTFSLPLRAILGFSFIKKNNVTRINSMNIYYYH